jgi:hypothetical protein
MAIASIVVPTLMPDSKRCNRCKAADKNCTVSGDATSRRKSCDRCKGLKQGCSLSDKTSHTDSVEGGSAVHSVTSSLADRVELIDMTSGADTPIRGDKRKASEAASNTSSPEGQPLKTRSRTDMRAAAKASGSGVQAMGPPRPPQASRDKKIERLENQLVYAKEAFRLSVENIQEQLDQLKEEEAKAVMVTRKGPTSGARGRGGGNSKGKSK